MDPHAMNPQEPVEDPALLDESVEPTVKLTPVQWQGLLNLIELGVRHAQADMFEPGGALMRMVATQVNEQIKEEQDG